MEDKTKKIAIRVTTEESAKIKGLAEKSGMTVSEYLRNAGLNGKRIDVLTPEILEILLYVQEEHSRLTVAVQEYKERNKDVSLGDYIQVRFWDAKCLEMNRKLRYIEDSLKEILAGGYGDTTSNADKA